MTNQVHTLASRLYLSTHRHTFRRLGAIIAAGSPVPLTVKKSAQRASVNISFYNHRSIMNVFTTTRVVCFGDQLSLNWVVTISEDLWPIPKSELASWLIERLNIPIPDDLLSQSKLCARLSVAKNLSEELSQVRYAEYLPKYHRIRNHPA